MRKERGMLSAKIFDSRIKSANVQPSERWLGFFAGPGISAMAYCICAGTYLNVFYTDVVKISGFAGGLFLTLLPILSKIFDAFTNIIMGRIIDLTKSRQGKARPWMLISAPLLVIAGILLYWVPQGNQTVQAIWIAVSYNLYFSFAYTIYNMSSALMVPLSTRNHTQRDGLALFSNMAVSMLPGALVYMFVPIFILPWMGVDASRWATLMSVMSIIVLPAILLQYYYTKERITEETANMPEEDDVEISMTQQLKACLKSKNWIIIMVITVIWQLQQNFYNSATIYYSNWVLGTYNDGITQTLVNAIGQFPLGVGVFLLWPVVKKFGKQRTLLIGMGIAAVFSALILLSPSSMPFVLGVIFVKSFGMLPTYLFAAFLAEALDHVEWKNGFRCDGFSASIYNLLVTISLGVSTGLFNLGLSVTGYVPPAEDGSWVAQNSVTQTFFIIGFCLIPAIAYALVGILISFYDAEKLGDKIRSDITERHRAAAEARGEVYVSPEEKAKQEKEEQDRIAEERRIEELKERCAKKGLNFEEEEGKYQAKLARKKAKGK